MRPPSGVKFHPGLSSLFSPAEIVFILHMVDIKILENRGHQTNWSKPEYLAIMGLSEHTFDKCVKKLVDMELLVRNHNKRGNRVYYSWNNKLYQKLTEILSITRSHQKLNQFCESEFKVKGRAIESISKVEMEALRH